jgi:hypothetical protein
MGILFPTHKGRPQGGTGQPKSNPYPAVDAGAALTHWTQTRGAYPVSSLKKIRNQFITYRHSEMKQLKKRTKAPVMFEEM